MCRTAAIVFYLFLGVSPAFCSGLPREDLRPLLPPVIHAAQNVPITIFFANTILCCRPDKLVCSVKCDFGEADSEHWYAVPGPDQLGEHTFTLTVRTPGGIRKTTLFTPTGQDTKKSATPFTPGYVLSLRKIPANLAIDVWLMLLFKRVS